MVAFATTSRTAAFWLLRRCTNLAKRLLRGIRYRGRSDPFREFVRLGDGQPLPEHGQDCVALLPVRVSPESNLFEGVVGHALRRRRYRVVAMLCGQALRACDHKSVRSRGHVSCALCLAEQQRFGPTFDIENAWVNDLVGPARRRELRQRADVVSLDTVGTYDHEGVPIGKHAAAGLQRYTLCSRPDLEVWAPTAREFLYTAMVMVDAVRQMARRYRPKFFLSSHGTYSTWGAAIEACIADKHPVVVWGRGYVGAGNIIASHDASYLLTALHEPTDLWEQIALSDEQRDALTDYYRAKRDPASRADHTTYYTTTTSNSSDGVLDRLGLDPGRPRLGLYPNIPWDGKMFCSTPEFPEIFDFVSAVLDWLGTRPDADLIVRAHPAEARRAREPTVETFESILREVADPLPANLRFVSPTDSVSSYAIADVCQAAVVYGSTLGLEFAVAGHPVIQVGRNNVSNKGIVFEISSRRELTEILNRAVDGTLSMPEQMRERAIQYAYHWIFRRHIPETVLDLEQLTFQRYRIQSRDELGQGQNEVIDWFIDRCESGEPFVLAGNGV